MKKSVEERAFLLQQRLARRAEKGLKVPQEFLDCASSMGSLFVKTMQSFNQARALSEMIHSNEHGLSSIQEQLTEHPINALTLMNIISIERAKGESDLEKHLKTKNGQDNAQKKLDNDPKQKWKRETVKPEWENWQSQSVLYASKADFARKMMGLSSCPLSNDDETRGIKTISGWCNEWEKDHGKDKSVYAERKEGIDRTNQLLDLLPFQKHP